MIIALIAAMDRNRTIGHAGKLPWHLPADLQWFKRHTMGHTLLMGRRTFEAIGHPLPGRRTIVLSRKPDYQAPGCMVATDIAAAIATAKPAEQLFVCGGGEIYRQTLDQAERIYLTELDIEVSGDTFFPEFDEDAFKIVLQEHQVEPFHYRFSLFQRKHQPQPLSFKMKEVSL
ncbi:dihydrofolate reductase [Pelovirga terrestris]|uniref:Dihydrofolate reductase n=1 Tax=Pelovirga terrestris TaxID=2771352 RepID=A0A8J6QUJ5_9BACT|nr:dihydrofolate reductase [Pelovirga terrestris]MBD1400370.1 dihydrofolate reductase [Pelovirga terrestris]